MSGDILVSVLWSFLVLWIVLQFIPREKFEKWGIERSPLTLIFRSKKGLALIDGAAKKGEGFLKKLGSIGVYLSLPLMLLVVVSLFLSAGHILRTPDAPPGVAPLLPEGVVEIEGVPAVPWEFWLISIVTILVFHEIMHGLLARAENIPLKSLGIFSLTFIPLGAFVEPDDDVLEEKKTMSKLRVYAAGSLGNFIAAILGGLALLLLLFVLAPLAFQNNGLTIWNVTAGSPAHIAGLTTNVTLLGIGAVDIRNVDDFQKAVAQIRPGVEVPVRTSAGSYRVMPVEREGFVHGFIGIAVAPDMVARTLVAKTIGEERAFKFYGTALQGLYWIIILNFLVGLTNLLPIIPLDGGRMFALFMEEAVPKKSGELTTLMYLFLLALVFINAGPLFGLF